MDSDPGTPRRLLPALALLSLAAFALLAAPAAATPILAVTSPAGTPTYTPLDTYALSGWVDPPTANLSLNGGPDFSDGSGNFSVTLALAEGNNTFALRADDGAGDPAWSNFTIVRDFTPPTLVVTRPLETETVTNGATYTVHGHVDDLDASVTLNGGPVELDGTGNFSVDYALTDGLNVLLFNARDMAGNQVAVVRTITYDRYAPFLLVDAPADGLRTNQTWVQVLGRSERDARVQVNGFDTPVNPLDGTFALHVTLDALFAETENYLVIRAVDRAGNIAFANRTVVVDIRAPSIDLDLDPEVESRIEQGTPLNSSAFVVRGTTDTVGAIITVSGVAVPLEGLSFEITVVLQEGPNSILVSARDDLGNERTVALLVLADTLPPALEVTSPSSRDFRTARTTLAIAGSVDGGPGVIVNVRYVDARGAQAEQVVVSAAGSGAFFSFEHALELNADGGSHSVTVEALDAALNRATFTFTYVVDLTAPALTVTPPPSTLTHPALWINGSTDTGIGAVLIEGEPHPVLGGHFAVRWELPAREGEHSIRITVENEVGTQTSVVLQVWLDLPEVPAAASLHVDGSQTTDVLAGAPVRLSLDPPLPPGVTSVWSVDGHLVGAGESVEVSLAPGDHVVTVVVSNGADSEEFMYTLHAGTASAAPGGAGDVALLGGGAAAAA
ncbi:MAG TPA: hypothetical protein VGB42_10655, partial [Candidatus Thermoplasmatota archaeon]